MTRRTKKLVQASMMLASEQFCDSDDEAILRAVLAGKVTTNQVYKALHHFGFRWNGVYWTPVYPKWILNFYKTERSLDQ
jgi:hypothetical protein